MKPLIKVSNLNKSFGKAQVLKQLDLEVFPGQILGLVGPNGAGKSTCLHALLGLARYEGDIDICGYNPLKQRAKMLEDVAYISDVAVLPKWLLVNDALNYVDSVHPNFNIAKARGFLAKTNISETAKVKTLSKGMVTQLHLALILAIDAKVLVLDEPTLGLDILTRRQFYKHLLEDFYSEDRCIVVTTHQIEEIENILTDVAFIKDGSIVLADNCESLQSRFQLLVVDNENLTEAQKLAPLSSNSMMGLHSLLIDTQGLEQGHVPLSDLGKVQTASLADIFVACMSSDTTALKGSSVASTVANKTHQAEGESL
jgi:ABC-2 type transport system ATP-binding protein